MNFLFGFILCGLTILVIPQNVAAENKEIILYTTSSGDYFDWYPVRDSKVFKFKIRAQAFTLNLASYPVNELPKIEIGVCHPHASSFGVIWRDNNDVASLNINSKYYANENKFISYWVTWFNNNIVIGIEGETTGFLTYNDPKEFAINYIGVHTIASQKKGIWIIKNN